MTAPVALISSPGLPVLIRELKARMNPAQIDFDLERLLNSNGSSAFFAGERIREGIAGHFSTLRDRVATGSAVATYDVQAGDLCAVQSVVAGAIAAWQPAGVGRAGALADGRRALGREGGIGAWEGVVDPVARAV